MKYFYDTEFLEGTQKRFFGKTAPTIDLISIGIVAEDGEEYYAVSKEFNLKEAWNRYDEKVEKVYGDMRNNYPEGRKYRDYWIRENVLRPIFTDLYNRHKHLTPVYQNCSNRFTYSNLKFLIHAFGKTRKQISDDIQSMTGFYPEFVTLKPCKTRGGFIGTAVGAPEFYGYYSAYDHVALCWLFGKMMNLPEGFPMYTRDLKQMLDIRIEKSSTWISSCSLEDRIRDLKESDEFSFPKQTDEHHALADAKWNKALYDWLNTF